MKKKELLNKAKPILFKSEMVTAILDGRKTVTRRVIKPQPCMPICYTFAGNGAGTWGYPSKDAYIHWNDSYKWPDEMSIDESKRIWKPPYHADDILYVRETWCKGRIDCGEEPDGRDVLYISQCTGENDIIPLEYAISHEIGIEDVKWKPSIHMPKEAARIFLKVKNVRVERLQDITEEQAKAEGCQAGSHEYKGAVWGQEDTDEWTAVESFKDLWNSTIKNQYLNKYGWKANPYVWVIEFERIGEAD